MAVLKVPATDSEAIKSSLMSLFEKRRVGQLYKFVAEFDKNDKKTWKKLDVEKQPMKDVFKHYGIEDTSVDFLGHAVALHSSDAFLEEPAIDTISKMQLYTESQGRYGDSPFLYPIYGIGGLPEAFSRLCAIHGGTYMLNTAVDEITMEGGKVTGIKCGEDTAKAPLVICDPSYAPDAMLKPTGQAIRAVCLLDHPIPGTGDVPSVQVILPAKQLKRVNGKYINFDLCRHIHFDGLLCAPDLRSGLLRCHGVDDG